MSDTGTALLRASFFTLKFGFKLTKIVKVIAKPLMSGKGVMGGRFRVHLEKAEAVDGLSDRRQPADERPSGVVQG